MKTSTGITLKSLLVSALITGFCSLAISNPAHATPPTEGFCDCSISGEPICHIPPGNHENEHTIFVGESALDAHLNHGDMLGACPGDGDDEEYGAEHANNAEHARNNEHASGDDLTCTCADGTAGNWNNPESTAVYSLRSVQGE